MTMRRRSFLSLMLAGALVMPNTKSFLAAEKTSKILIAYFSFSGNTRLIARDIESFVGGDFFEIQSQTPIQGDFESMVEAARRELATNARPALVRKIDNLDQYDTIFVGFPNWVGTMPMVLFSFLEAHDFKGKTLIPFCTHGTSGISNTISDFEAHANGGKVLRYFDVYRSDVQTARPQVKEWLQSLGFDVKE